MRDTTTAPARYLSLRRTNGALELWTEGDLSAGYGYAGAGAPRAPHGEYAHNAASDGWERRPPTPEQLAAYEAAAAVYVNPLAPERREISFASGPSKVGNLAKRLRRPSLIVAERLAALDAQIESLQRERSGLIGEAWASGDPLGVAEICAIVEAPDTTKGPSRRGIEGRLAPVFDEVSRLAEAVA